MPLTLQDVNLDDTLQLGTNFTNWDWVIVVAYLSGSVAIGLFANRYIRNMADYIVAGRSLRSFISIATMLGSEVGLVTVMYTAQKGFTGGFSAFHIGICAGIVPLIVGLTGFIVVPLREAKVKTIPEYYGLRFGKGVRVLGGFILTVAGILNMGVFLKAGAIFVTALTGLHDPMVVNIVMTVLIVLVLIYTILGGMVSVVITDYIQFIVLSVALMLTAFFAAYELGWTHIIDTVEKVHGESGFNPFAEGEYGLSYVLWSFFRFRSRVFGGLAHGRDSRVCGGKTCRSFAGYTRFSSIGFMTRFILPQFLGICALVYFWQHDVGRELFFAAEGGGVIADPDITLKAMPCFLAQILPAGAIGIVCAGMLAAFMSTHDSYLLCWASVFVEDVVNPIMGGGLSTQARLTMARVFILLSAVFLLVWSLWYPLGQDMLDYLAVTGAVYASGAFALLLFGLYWKRASSVGAYLGLIAGTFAVLGLKPVQQLVNLSDMLGTQPTVAHIGLVTVGLSLVLMVLGSLLFSRFVRRTEKIMIDGWATFWTWVLIGTAIVFTCLAIAVAIGGFFDIRTLLKTIDRQHEEAETEQDGQNNGV